MKCARVSVSRALYIYRWCVWGEAGNMRFMPEFLSWVYHQFVTELVLGTGGQRKEAWRCGNVFFVLPFYTKNRMFFAKTGSGQTQEKLKRRDSLFLQAARLSEPSHQADVPAPFKNDG